MSIDVIKFTDFNDSYILLFFFSADIFDDEMSETEESVKENKTVEVRQFSYV